MIGARGPKNTLVLERNCVAVNDICAAVINDDIPDRITERFPVTEEEIFECIDAYIDMRGPTENDFVEFEWDNMHGQDNEIDIDVTTTGISDWVYLSVLTYGKAFSPTERRFPELYARGLESIFTDCLEDIQSGNRQFEDVSKVHEIIFSSFEKVYKPVDAQRASELLNAWQSK